RLLIGLRLEVASICIKSRGAVGKSRSLIVCACCRLAGNGPRRRYVSSRPTDQRLLTARISLHSFHLLALARPGSSPLQHFLHLLAHSLIAIPSWRLVSSGASTPCSINITVSHGFTIATCGNKYTTKVL